MQNRQLKFSVKTCATFISIIFICSSTAAEKIIQKEKMSFEKCLDVITTSENKLFISPEIIDETDRKRIAVFRLVDGTLKITCDRHKEIVTVSVNYD